MHDLTPDQCRHARQLLGFSASEMAARLGLSDGRAVRRFEAGEGAATARAPQGPLAVLYRLILAGRLTAQDLTGVD
jgi:transcriptional regulator with XRE-family HTH domain